MSKNLLKYTIITSGIALISVLSAVYLGIKTETNSIIVFAIAVPIALTTIIFTTRKLRKQIKEEANK